MRLSWGTTRHAQLRLRKAELGPLAGDDEVAPGDEGQPVAEAGPVHRGDHRLEDLPAALEGVEGGLLPERAGELAGRPAAVLQVGAGAEGSPRPGDDGDPGVLLVAEP